MVLSDRTTGLAIAALGVSAAIGGSRLPPVPGQPVGPELFPIVIGIGLLLCGLLVAFGIGRGFEESASIEAPEIAASREPASRLLGLRAAVPPLLLVFYVLAVDTLGFVPTAAIMIGILCALFFGGWRLALTLAIAGPIVVHLAFYKLLRVPLPAGWLPMPW